MTQSKRPNTQKEKCVHCLAVPDFITDDHVIPKSWYSTEYSSSARKPTAPSCYECNQELGRHERLLSHVMWMSMPAVHPLVPELRQRVFRACGMTPDGKPLPNLSPEERRIRLQYARELLKTTFPASQIDEKLLLPGFGFHPEYPHQRQRATRLDGKLLEEVASKVVRGLEYIQGRRNRYVEPPYYIEVYFPRNPEDSNLKTVRNLCPIFSDGTNTIQRGAVSDTPLEPIYIIRLWNHWEIWGVITREKNV